MAITFDKLRADAKIFEELSKNPSWWVYFKNDSDLYIEIRKDNQVNVYYEGGSIARIHFCSKHKKLQVFTHHKYLDEPAPSKNNLYIECSDIMSKQVIEQIKRKVKGCYSQKHAVKEVIAKEKWSEKYIQGSLIVRSSDIHLDSEFAYNDATSRNRIDLIRCDEGVVTFVELKRMSDGRMLHRTDEPSEIIKQMQRYKEFINRYSNDLLHYYQTLYDIKKSLELPVPDKRPTRINQEPQLLIFDCWEKEHPSRDTHRTRLEDILKREHVIYSIRTSL